MTKKRQRFLQAVIQELQLTDITVCDKDWRTFLRKTESKIDYFVTRASLDPAELIRMFKPACPYKNAKLVYWASDEWQPEPKVEPFVQSEFAYKIKRTRRKLVFLGLGDQK